MSSSPPSPISAVRNYDCAGESCPLTYKAADKCDYQLLRKGYSTQRHLLLNSAVGRKIFIRTCSPSGVIFYIDLDCSETGENREHFLCSGKKLPLSLNLTKMSESEPIADNCQIPNSIIEGTLNSSDFDIAFICSSGLCIFSRSVEGISSQFYPFSESSEDEFKAVKFRNQNCLVALPVVKYSELLENSQEIESHLVMTSNRIRNNIQQQFSNRLEQIKEQDAILSEQIEIFDSNFRQGIQDLVADIRKVSNGFEVNSERYREASTALSHFISSCSLLDDVNELYNELNNTMKALNDKISSIESVRRSSLIL
jgi:hypothetical protein